MSEIDLSKYKKEYKREKLWKDLLWYACKIFIFASNVPFPNGFKVRLLKIFGARVGDGVLFKPSVNIKYPWRLNIGNNVFIGEGVWIDNLATVNIANNVCISQGALIETGNHNYKKSSFDLMLGPVDIEDGVWVGAKAVICPGVKLARKCFITAGSVVTKRTEESKIYSGNPAIAVKDRILEG